MNHYLAIQPTHLGGKWQYALTSSRGGGPVCGCDLNEGHETREEAERHHYDTSLASCEPRITSSGQAEACTGCGEWTPRYVTGTGIFSTLHIPACESCVPADNQSLLDALTKARPFMPGIETFSL